MIRNGYEVRDLDGFKALLDYLAGKGTFPPIFVHWGSDEDGVAATFHVEGWDFYTAFTLVAPQPKDIDAFKEAHSQHRFIDAQWIDQCDEQRYEVIVPARRTEPMPDTHS